MYLKVVYVVVVLHLFVHVIICCNNQTFTDASVKIFTGYRIRRFKVDGCIDYTEENKKIQTMTFTGSTPIIYEGAIQNLNSVREIYMFNNGIKEIKHGAFVNLSSLEALHLERNEIEEIKKEHFFENLPLQNLSFRYNKISYIEAETFLNTSLETVVLSWNKLEEFAAEWFIESNLINVYVDHNKLQYIPGNAFQDLTQLTYISFAANDITTIHKHTFGNISLRSISLNNNALFLFSPQWFIRSNIEYLDISYNYIRYIPQYAFKNLNKLVSVNFAYNNITGVHHNAFKGALNLKILDLNNNKIKMLHNELFDPHHAYHLISLHTNYLTFLSKQFRNNINTTYITIHTNPWQCACYFDITDWLNQASISVLARKRGCTRYTNPVCATPVGHNFTCTEEILEDIYTEYYRTFNFKFCKNLFHFGQLLQDGYVSCTNERNAFCTTYEKYFPNN